MASEITNHKAERPGHISRRDVIGLVPGGAAALAFGGEAWARASIKATIKSGDVKVTALSDGHLVLPATMFAPQIKADVRQAALAKAGQTGAEIKSPLNVTLVEAGVNKVLIDVGSGGRFMDTAGKLADSLSAVGVEPDAITHVVYTHAHPDHLWGTLDDFDEVSFPSAQFYISEQEWNFWMAKDVLSKLPKERHGFAVGAQRNLNAVKDKLTTIKPGSELLSGIQVIDTGGHTPGHISLEIGRGNDRVVVLGDALTHPVISFQHPDWRPATDQLPERAVATRKKLLGKLASDGSRIIGYHLTAPGTGRVVRKGNGHAFEPLA